MLQIDGGARILQLRKMHYDLVQGNMPAVCHRLFSVRRREYSNTENGIPINRSGRKHPKLPRPPKVPLALSPIVYLLGILILHSSNPDMLQR